MEKTYIVKITDDLKAKWTALTKEERKALNERIRELIQEHYERHLASNTAESNTAENTSQETVNTPRFKPIAGYSDRFHKPLEELDGDQIVSDLFE